VFISACKYILCRHAPLFFLFYHLNRIKKVPNGHRCVEPSLFGRGQTLSASMCTYSILVSVIICFDTYLSYPTVRYDSNDSNHSNHSNDKKDGAQTHLHIIIKG
jgi:hypothetical protein